MKQNRIHVALVAGSAALALVACDARQTPGAPYTTPAAPVDISAPPVAVPAAPISISDREMEGCIFAAPPRADGQASEVSGVRDETTNLFTSVRESIGGIVIYYAPNTNGQIVVDRGGMMIPETLPPGGPAASRATHLGYCVTRANQATRPVELPSDEPIFKTQRTPQ